MALVIRELIKGYYYMNVEISDPRMQHLPFITTPFPLVGLLGFYVYFVKELGPRLMQDKKPFQLDRVLQLYNIIQIGLSFWIAERITYLGWFTNYDKTCQPVDFSDDPQALYMSKIVYIYFLIKITDLLDTIFFVLRKKNNQVTFLHVYHHSGMVLATWVAAKYLPGGHCVFIILINSAVHAVMYSYYLLTSLYPEYKKNIWWKKYITQIQMIQFLLITLHTGQLLFQPQCNYPIIIPLLLTPQNFFMLILFYDFYRKAYTKEKITESLKQSQ